MKIESQALSLSPQTASMLSLKKASLEFERLLVEQMLSSMEKSLENGFFESSGSASSYYGGLFREALSKEMVGETGMGLSMMLQEQAQFRPSGTMSSSLNYLERNPSKAASLYRWNPPTDDVKRKMQDLVCLEAERAGVPENLALMLVEAESGFDSKARSRVGAMGLTQLMPATADALGVKNPWNAEENIAGGLRYLRGLMDRFDGNRRLALAAYNAGPEAVEKHGGVPPYPETIDYIARIEGGIARIEGGLGETL
jgi:Rod binding domain-containing protein